MFLVMFSFYFFKIKTKFPELRITLTVTHWECWLCRVEDLPAEDLNSRRLGGAVLTQPLTDYFKLIPIIRDGRVLQAVRLLFHNH